MPVCPSCGEENSERARFCQACGSALAVEPVRPKREVRKTVTILFSDLAGSTALGERLDPEALRTVMQRYFDGQRAVIERHGGVVEKFIGDAIMAVFGIPVLHEDDALRAVRAAVEMRESLRELNKELERDAGVTIRVRTGINTGEVVAGEGDETLVTGDAVNVAARFEQVAGEGEILIGAETLRLVRDAVEVEGVEPLTLKGKSEPVPAYRLAGVVSGAAPFARHLDSPMVGREYEASALVQAFERVAKDRTVHLFTVLGPAGIGKSRLVQELVDAVRDDAAVLTGRCLPYGDGITFWPMIEVIGQAAGFGPGHAPDEVRALLSALLDGEPQGDLVVERLAQLLGLSAEKATVEELYWAARKLFEALARRRPLVVVFDDIHWAEPAFLDLIEHVSDWSHDVPILLACMARSELLEARPAWGGGKRNASTLQLEPLSSIESEKLVVNLLTRAPLPGDVRDRIVAAAEGNPLFLEEMLGMLIDDGVLRRDAGGWSPAGNLSSVRVPPTISALIASRLDRLSDDERAVIEHASIVGKDFEVASVIELWPAGTPARARASLLNLMRKELIRPDARSLAGDDAFQFRHILIRDAAYAAIPKEQRADLHARYAGRLSETSGDEFDEIVGYHLEESAKLLRDLKVARERIDAVASPAADRLMAAARKAAGRGDHNAQRTFLTRAAELLDRADQRRRVVLPEIAFAATLAGDFTSALAFADEAARVAAETGDALLEARALLARIEVRYSTDPNLDLDDLAPTLMDLRRRLEAGGTPRDLAAITRLIAMVSWMRARAGDAMEELRVALAYAREAEDPLIEQQCLSFIVAAYGLGPTPITEAVSALDGIIPPSKAASSMRGNVMCFRAAMLARLGRFDDADRLLEEGARAWREIGLDLDASMVPYEIGYMIARLKGDDAGALALQTQAFEALDALGEKSYASTVAAYIADLLADAGRGDEALRYAEVSRDYAIAQDLASNIGWRGAKAKVLAQRGDVAQGERLAREALALAADSDFFLVRSEARLALASVLRSAGKNTEAADLVRGAIEVYESKGDLVTPPRLRALLQEIEA